MNQLVSEDCLFQEQQRIFCNGEYETLADSWDVSNIPYSYAYCGWNLHGKENNRRIKNMVMIYSYIPQF
jgi:hypothetical protein